MTLRPCRECGKEVSTEAEACPNCGVPHPTYRPGQDKGESSGCFKIFLFLIPFFLGYGVLVTVCAPTDSETGNGSDESADCMATAGDMTRIDTDDEKPAYLGRTETALDEFVETLANGDRLGFKQLLQSGRVVRVRDGMSVRVLNREGFGGNRVEVRIQEGPYRGEAGWVLAESLRC